VDCGTRVYASYFISVNSSAALIRKILGSATSGRHVLKAYLLVIYSRPLPPPGGAYQDLHNNLLDTRILQLVKF
jgi:hypothetical protein